MDAQGHGRRPRDFRIIFKSEQIVNSPMAYLADLPADLKAAIKKAVLEHRRPRTRPPSTSSPKASSSRSSRVDHKDYEPVIELIKFVDSIRKKKS